MAFKIPLVGKGITLNEIPHNISVYFEIGGCIKKCFNCHSPHHQNVGEWVDCRYLVDYACQQKSRGATAIVLMGGTTSKYITKENLQRVINMLSEILPVGLYSGADIDDFFMSNQNLSWFKCGAYVDNLGGLNSSTTNQYFFQRNISGEWEIKNELFQTTTQQREKNLDL